MSYQFKYKELEKLSNEIKANAKQQLAALSQAEAVINRLAKSDAMAGKASDNMKGYFANTYGTVIPTMKLLIANHSKNCQLYIKAYDAKRMGGNTAIKVEEITEVMEQLRGHRNAAESFFTDDHSMRTNGEFTSALEGNVEKARLHHDPKEDARTQMIKLINDTNNDITAIERFYAKNESPTGEFTSARVALTSLNSLFKARAAAGPKIKDFNYGSDYWNSEDGTNLRKACIGLYYEAEAKKDYYTQDDMVISEDEINPMAFDERTNGDDLYDNPYYNEPFNAFPVNWEGQGGNCTWYAWGRYQEAQGYTERDPNLDMNGNADEWFKYAQNNGYETGQTPKPGAIMVWRYPNDKWGHVAFVERVDKDGTVHTSESGWRGGKFWTDTYDSKGTRSGREFLGYIYPKKSTPIQMTSSEKKYYDGLKDSSGSSKSTLADLQTRKTSSVTVKKAATVTEKPKTVETKTTPKTSEPKTASKASEQKSTPKTTEQKTTPKSTDTKTPSKTTEQTTKKATEQTAKKVTEQTSKKATETATKELTDKTQKAVDKTVAETKKVTEPKKETYTVKSGDTLWDIGKEYGVDYHKIAEDNNISNPSLIHPGEEFVIEQN